MNWLADEITTGASSSSVNFHARSEIIQLLIDIVVYWYRLNEIERDIEGGATSISAHTHIHYHLE